MGASFEPYLPAVMLGNMRFLGPQRSVTDRIMGLGLIADLARHTGAAFAPYVAAVVPLVLRGLADPDPGLARNAAFAVGRLLADVTAAARPFAPQLLTALQPLFAVPRGNSEAEAMIDNAAGALAAAAIALPDVIPAAVAVPAVASKLPIVSDHGEAGPALRYLLSQLHAGTPAALAALPQIVLGCAAVLLPGAPAAAGVRESVAAAGLRHFQRIASDAHRASLAAAVAALPSPELQAAVAAALR